MSISFQAHVHSLSKSNPNSSNMIDDDEIATVERPNYNLDNSDLGSSLYYNNRRFFVHYSTIVLLIMMFCLYLMLIQYSLICCTLPFQWKQAMIQNTWKHQYNRSNRHSWYDNEIDFSENHSSNFNDSFSTFEKDILEFMNHTNLSSDIHNANNSALRLSDLYESSFFNASIEKLKASDGIFISNNL